MRFLLWRCNGWPVLEIWCGDVLMMVGPRSCPWTPRVVSVVVGEDEQ